MTTTAAVLNQACTYLGGAYDATRRWYSTGTATPPVANVYVVKRAFGKDFNARDFTYGAAPDSVSVGALGVVTIGDSGSREQRIAVAGQSGLKKVMEDMTIELYFRGNSSHAEDVHDAMVATIDSMKALIRADKTMGSGGFEAAGFQVAETSPWLVWRKSKVESTAGISKGYVYFSTEAHYYVVA